MISASSWRAVAMMTGVVVTARIIFSACWPSRSGRPRSRTITSGECWLTSLIPSSAVPTVRTACARWVRSAAIADRTNGSSSIMSTRAMSGTLCIRRPACGIIADMTRALTGLAAWLAGTALAVGLAWFGANMVVRDAGMSPGVQVINVAPAIARPRNRRPRPLARFARTARFVRSPGASGSPAASQPGPSAATSSPSPSTTPSAAAAGTVRSYTLAGGRVALDVSGDSAALVTAMPDSGFSVQTWSGTDWLRVDFSSGAQVSSLIASWYQHAPTVTVEN